MLGPGTLDAPNLRTVWNFIFWTCNKKLMTLDTHIQAQRLDKFSMFVKKTGFPKLEPLLWTNQYDGVSYRGVERFPVGFFLVKPKWMLRYSPKPTGCNQDIWANPRKSLKQSLKKLPYSVYYLHLPVSLNHLSTVDIIPQKGIVMHGSCWLCIS